MPRRESVDLMRRFGTLLLGLGLLTALLAARPASAASRLGLNLYGFSHHFDRRAEDGYEFNETNLGGGLDWVIRRGPRHTLFADVGAHRDSFRRTNTHGSIAWTHALVGPLQGGFGLAIASTQSANDGELFMGLGPLLSLRTDRGAIHVAYLPEENDVNGYPALATWATLYPFGPVRVERAAAAAALDSNFTTGLEFTVDGHFVLSAPDGAALAIKRRSGDCGWRVAADVSGYVNSSSSVWWRGGNQETPTNLSSGRFRFEGRAQKLSYAGVRKGPELFLGYGPLLGYDNAGRTWRVGLVGSCGVEWRLAEILSLGAEYGLDFVYTDTHSESWPGDRLTKLHDWSLDLKPRAVRLALTAWFD